jgi:predicted hydrocarbon binding protein
MSEQFDFERAWLEKFLYCLDKLAGLATRQEVMRGSEELCSDSPREDVIAWSISAMERLDNLVDEEKRADIMTGCACQYPKADLREIREAYQESKDLSSVHQMLQNKFEFFLKDTLELSEEMVDDIIGKGWGLAGTIQGNSIIATKIPKSGYLVEYMQEEDPAVKRQYYCHCPRIRDMLKSSERISPTYCYCGAGFYKGIWEQILGEPVEVEVLESVLQGDEVCKVAIHLPQYIIRGLSALKNEFGI